MIWIAFGLAAAVAVFLMVGGMTTLRKSQAAVAVQNLLEAHPSVVMVDFAPAKLANRLVGDAWDQRDQQFRAKDKPYPQKRSIAIIALADGLSSLRAEADAWNATFFALGFALTDIERNGHRYAFNGTDRYLLGVAQQVYLEEAARLEQRQDGVLGQPGL